MTTLYDATLELAKIITDVIEGTATGGSGTTLVDTGRLEPDEHFNSGVIWFRSGNNEDKSAKISDYDLTTHTFTFVTPGAACAADDLYSVATADYPRYVLMQMINTALADLGDLEAYDVSLVTVSGQESYDLPSGVRNILGVEVATSTTTPYNYKPHFNWREIDGDLFLDDGQEFYTDDYIIRLRYTAAHAALTTDAGEINAAVPIGLLKWAAAVHAIEWRMKKARADAPQLGADLAIAREKLALAKHDHPMERQNRRDPHYSNW